MLFYFFIFIFGIAVGSFLNVLIYRLPQEKSIRGRSACPKCGHILGWQDLVPVLSFILLKGRCRYCHKSISPQYPIVELATGILFLFLSFYVWNLEFGIWNLFGNWKLGIGNLINLIYLFFITSCLIVIFVSDLKYFIIPDKIIIAGVIGIFLYRLFGIWNFKIWDLFGNWKLEIGNWKILSFYLLAALGAGIFFLAIVVATKGKGMGLGDAKLAFLMGLILGWPKILIALLLAFVSGALLGLGLIFTGRATMKTHVPFGTSLTASTFLVMVWGGAIISGYFELPF